MKRFTPFQKTIAVILALLVFLSGLSIVSVSAADISQEGTGRDLVYVDENGATFDQVATGADIPCTLNSDASYGIQWNTKGKTIYFTNQVTGKSDQFWHYDNMSYDTMTPNNGDPKQIVFCIQPHTRYLSGYRIIDTSDSKNPANTKYWKLFMNNAHEKLRNSIAEVIAFARPMINNAASDGLKHSYYIAAQLIIWELIAGYRKTGTYTIDSDKKLTKFITGSSAKVTNVKNCYKEIIKTITELDKITSEVYSSISKAKAVRDNDDNCYMIAPMKAGATSMTTSEKIKGFKKNYWESVTIVNQDGKTPSDVYGLSVSFDKDKDGKRTGNLIVKQKKSIADTSSTYYFKFVKKLPDFSKSENNVGYNTASTAEGANASQNLISKLKYDKEVVAYYPIKQRKNTEEPKKGALQVVKSAIDRNDEDYDVDLSGWIFKVTNTKTKKPEYYNTNANGETTVIKNIDLGTSFSVQEAAGSTPVTRTITKGIRSDTFVFCQKSEKACGLLKPTVKKIVLWTIFREERLYLLTNATRPDKRF